MCREADPIHGHIFLLYQSCGRGVFKAAKCLAMQVLIPKYGYKGVVAKTLAAPHTAHCKLFHKVCLRVFKALIIVSYVEIKPIKHICYASH